MPGPDASAQQESLFPDSARNNHDGIRIYELIEEVPDAFVGVDASNDGLAGCLSTKYPEQVADESESALPRLGIFNPDRYSSPMSVAKRPRLK